MAWTERDITESQEDLRDYGEMIPVTLIDGVQHDFWRVDERRLRRALDVLSANIRRLGASASTLCKRSQGRTVLSESMIRAT